MAQIFGTQEQLYALLEAVISALARTEFFFARLHSSPTDNEALQESSQQMHVIGRAASLLEWPQLAELAHGTEGILTDVLDGIIRLDPPMLTHLQSSLHTMQRLLQSLQSPDRPSTWPPTLEGRGNVVISVLHTTDGSEGDREAEHRAAPAPPAPRPNPEPLNKAVSPLGRPQQIEARPTEQSTPRSLAVIVELQQQRKSGILLLRRGSAISAEEGRIGFKEGRIVHAEAGSRTGPKARNWLSTWGACRYIFYADEQHH